MAVRVHDADRHMVETDVKPRAPLALKCDVELLDRSVVGYHRQSELLLDEPAIRIWHGIGPVGDDLGPEHLEASTPRPPEQGAEIGAVPAEHVGLEGVDPRDLALEWIVRAAPFPSDVDGPKAT